MRASVLCSALAALALLVFGGCAVGSDPAGETPPDEAADWQAAFDEAGDERADDGACSGVRVADQRGFDARVALTFEGSGNAEVLRRIVAILRRNGVPATFFFDSLDIFEHQSATAGLLREIVADPLFMAGSEADGLSLVDPAIVDSFGPGPERIDDMVGTFQRASGTSGPGAPPKWFRFPRGQATCALATHARERGQRVVGWHVDAADWCFYTGDYCSPQEHPSMPDAYREDLIGWTMQQLRSKNGGIVRLSAEYAYTAEHLEDLIKAIRRGLEATRFVRIDDAGAFPLLNGASNAPRPFVGTACGDDSDCDFRVNGAQAFCHSLQRFCTVPCEGYCADRSGYEPTFCIEDPDAVLFDYEDLGIARGICVRQVQLQDECQDIVPLGDDWNGSNLGNGMWSERYVGESGAPETDFTYVCAYDFF